MHKSEWTKEFPWPLVDLKIYTNPALLSLLVLVWYFGVSNSWWIVVYKPPFGTPVFRSVLLPSKSGCFAKWQFVLPFIFRDNEANLEVKTSFIFGGLSIISWIYLTSTSQRLLGDHLRKLTICSSQHPVKEVQNPQNGLWKKGRGGTAR